MKTSNIITSLLPILIAGIVAVFIPQQSEADVTAAPANTTILSAGFTPLLAGKYVNPYTADGKRAKQEKLEKHASHDIIFI